MNETVRRIHAVAFDLSMTGIAKDRENQHQKFRFRGIDDVYCALSPLLAKHGLVVVPSVQERIVTVLETKSGGSTYNVALRVCYIFRAAIQSDGGMAESFSADVWAEASDTGDKATSKAMSMAYKTMAFQVFCIPTEGQEDPDAATPEPSTPTLVPFPSGGFGSVEAALAFLPSLKTRERVAQWVAATKAEFSGKSDLEALKVGYAAFSKGVK